MSIHPKGTFPGTIIDAGMGLAYQSDTDLVLVLECETEHGYITCKHKLFGKYLDKTKEVFESLGIPLPEGVDNVGDLTGKEVEVYVGHFNKENGETTAYGKINTGGPTDPEAVKRAIAKFKGGDDVPF